MHLQTSKSANKLHRLFSSAVVLCIYVFMTGACQASEDIWSLLKRDGDLLDLMAVETVDERAIFIAARYIEKEWDAGEVPELNQPATASIRKLLDLISINKDEQVEWEKSYSAVPDVNEIFSNDRTPQGRLCIAYGRTYANDELINPTVLQIDPAGKILWADPGAIPESSLPAVSPRSYTQIANIESIRIVGSASNGCLLGYILRHESVAGENFQLNLLMFNEHGNLQWHFSRESELYGKMFIIRNNDANNYAVLQTNQSRDAAIQAMMAGKPFSPVTNLVFLSAEGKLLNFFDDKALPALSKTWVKHAVDASGENILLAGNLKNAWAGLMDSRGQLSKVNNMLDGEYSHVENLGSNQFMLVRGDNLVVLDEQLNALLNRPIDQLTVKKYVNTYIEKKLPEEGPIQNIVSIGKNAYFILYKLASRLIKIVVNQ